jgi:hypothetical protein
VHAPLAAAKELFAAAAFSSGCFFYHRRSRYIEAFRTYARDSVAQASRDHDSKYFQVNIIFELINYRTQGCSGIEKKDPGSIFLLRPILLD